MNLESMVRYLRFLLETRSLQWAFVRSRAREFGGGLHARRAHHNSKH